MREGNGFVSNDPSMEKTISLLNQNRRYRLTCCGSFSLRVRGKLIRCTVLVIGRAGISGLLTRPIYVFLQINYFGTRRGRRTFFSNQFAGSIGNRKYIYRTLCGCSRIVHLISAGVTGCLSSSDSSLALFTTLSPVASTVSSELTYQVQTALLGIFDGTIFHLSPVPLVLSETRTV